MASKERPTLHLKKNPDFPPKPPGPPDGEGFSPADERKKANEILDDLKREIYAAGLSPAQVSEAWQKARLTHDKILASIQEYRGTKDPEEQQALAHAIKEQIVELKGNREEDLRESLQAVAADKPKARGRVRSRTALPRNFNEVIQSNTAAEAKEFTAQIQSEIEEKKARLGELEAAEKGSGGKFNTDTLSNLREAREAEFLKTEQEVHELEEKLRLADLPLDHGEESLTHGETVNKLKGLVAGYEGEPHHPLPAMLPEDESLLARPTGASSTPEVISLPDQSAVQNEGTGFVPRTEAESMALETRGPEAMQKLALELGDGKRTSAEMAETSAPFAAKMYESEKAYFDALKVHHAERNIGSVMLEQFAGHHLPKEVQKLREEWVASRAEYAGFLKQSASERHMAKEGNAHGARREKVLERYQRIVTAREVVLGAEEAEQRAQLDGLDNRKRGWVDKAYEGYKKLPPGVRILGTTALLTTAGIVATGGGIFAVAPAGLALGRAGLRWAAEANKGTSIGNTASGLALIFSIGAVGGLVGQKGTELFHKAVGTERKAGEKLEQREELGNLGSAKQLDALSKSRQKALNVTETISRQSRWARMIGALTGGALFGHAVHGHDDGVSTHPVAANPVPAEPAPHIQTLHEYAQNPSATSPFTKDQFDQLSGNITLNPSAEDLKHFSHLGEGTPVSASVPVEHHDVAAAHETAPQAHHEQVQDTEKPHANYERAVNAQPSSPEAPVRLTNEDRNLIQEWEIKNGGLPPHSDEHMSEVLARLREDNGPDTFKDVHFETATHEAPVPAEAPAPAAETSVTPPEEPHAEPQEPEPAAHDTPDAVPAPAPAETPAVPETAPASPEPTHTEVSPLAPSSPETAPVPHTAPASQEESSASDQSSAPEEQSAETIAMNTHGLEIDKAATHIYTDKEGAMVAYGGTTDEQLKMTFKFLKAPENFGKTVLVMTSTPDPLTGQPNVAAVTSDDSPAGFKFVSVITDKNNVPISPPAANDLVKKIL